MGRKQKPYNARMAYILVGLGNPGEEYKNTRHSVGQMALDYLAKKFDASEWKEKSAANALAADFECGGEKVTLVKPLEFMNNSGKSVAPMVKTAKAAEKLVVIHDDLDLPLGTAKMCFNRGPGGHNGVKSIQRALKTEGFWRIRIGISPATASGKIKKVSGEEKVHDFILGSFKPAEKTELTKMFKKISESVELACEKGWYLAMNEFNQK